MKICNRCKIENIDAARFCKHCGSDDLYDPDFEIKEVKRKVEVKKNIRDFFICLLLMGIVIFGILVYQKIYLPSQYEKQCKNGDTTKCELLLENKPNSWKNLSYTQRENKINNIKEILCENGKNEYCYDVAINYINNYEYDKAEIYAKNTCKFDSYHCKNLAKLFSDKSQHKIAIPLYEINCEDGYTSSCEYLYEYYSKIDDLENIEIYGKKLCDLDSAKCKKPTRIKTKQETIAELEEDFQNAKNGSLEKVLLQAMLYAAGINKYKDDNLFWYMFPGFASYTSCYGAGVCSEYHLFKPYNIDFGIIIRKNGSIGFDGNLKEIPETIYKKYFIYGDYSQNFIGEKIDVSKIIKFLTDTKNSEFVITDSFDNFDEFATIQNVNLNTFYIEDKACFTMSSEEGNFKIEHGKDYNSNKCENIMQNSEVKKFINPKPKRFFATLNMGGAYLKDNLSKISCTIYANEHYLEYSTSQALLSHKLFYGIDNTRFIQNYKDLKNLEINFKKLGVTVFNYDFYNTGITDNQGYYLALQPNDYGINIIRYKHKSQINLSDLPNIIQCWEDK